MTDLELLDALTGAFRSVTIYKSDLADADRFTWHVSALRPDDRPDTGGIKTADRGGDVAIQGGNLHISHWGATRADALAGAVAVAADADRLLAVWTGEA